MTTSEQNLSSDHKPTLLIIIASVRDGRVGRSVGDWFIRKAQEQGQFDIQVADLKDLDLPLMTEPNHPKQKQYTQDYTKRWSATVDAADAVVFVMPEYNFGATAPLINAIDYLFQEWAYKPLGLVSYGGASGGMRAQQHIKGKISALNMPVITESVAIASVSDLVKDGTFESNEKYDANAITMLDALVQWEKAMHQLRVPAQ